MQCYSRNEMVGLLIDGGSLTEDAVVDHKCMIDVLLEP